MIKQRWSVGAAPRLAKAMLAAFAIVLAAVGASAAPAYAGNGGSFDADMLRNWATGRCLDSNFAGSVYTLNCNFGGYQWWNEAPTTRPNRFANEYMLKNSATGRCLDSNWSGDVYTNPCQNGNNHQAWIDTVYWTSAGKNVHVFKNLATGRVLDSNSAGAVYTLAPNGGGYQNWHAGY